MPATSAALRHTAGANVDPAWPDTPLLELVEEFEDQVDVRERHQRGPLRRDVRTTALAPQPLGERSLGGLLVGRIIPPDHNDLGPEKLVQEQVALGRASTRWRRSLSTRYTLIPSRAPAAESCRQWFDCAADPYTMQSAPSRSASAMRNSSMRVLLPPNASPVRSSRLTRMRGPPRSAENRSASSRGVGSFASDTRGTRSIRARSSLRSIGADDSGTAGENDTAYTSVIGAGPPQGEPERVIRRRDDGVLQAPLNPLAFGAMSTGCVHDGFGKSNS